MICYKFWRAWLFFADSVVILVFLGKWIWVLPEDEQKLSVREFDIAQRVKPEKHIQEINLE